MAISYYTSSPDGATLVHSGVTTSADTTNKSFSVSTSNESRTQYGYGNAPMDADAIENIASKIKAQSPNNTFGGNSALGDGGATKTYDTTEGFKDIKAVDAKGTFMDFNTMMNRIHKEFYLPITGQGYKEQLNNLSKNYNRFKLPNYDMEIKKGFAHVFFVRPLCHILTNGGTDVLPAVKPEGSFVDIFDQNPVLVKEICDNNVSHSSDFMFILSNYVKSFSLNDEELHSDTYGRTYTGYKISYGKTNIESKTAGTFSVTFGDDRILSIYKIHRMWTDYINAVYRGRIDPDPYNIINKILDYAGAVYYILTADDGETILFWSKYYGVYPTSIPSSQYSWNAGSFVSPDSITIQYNYSWKEDFNPNAIVEFNANAKLSSGDAATYEPVFDNNLWHMGSPIVGTPYIERVTGQNLPYNEKSVYKLRFKPAK